MWHIRTLMLWLYICMRQNSNDESKIHLLPLIQNVHSTVFFMLRRGSNQWISLLHGSNNACDKVVTKKNSKTNTNHAKKCIIWNLSCFSHHLPWWDNVGDEKQWTGQNVSRAEKTWFITFITPCRAFCLPYLIKSMGNWMTIILMIGLKMMRIRKPKKVSWILCSEYKPPLCPYLSAIINPLISCNKAGDN